MSSRFLIVAPLAVIVTLALFFLMRDLISASPEEQEQVASETIKLTPDLPEEISEPKIDVPPPDIEEPDSRPPTIDHDAVKASIETNTRIIDPGPQRPDTGPGRGDPVGPINTIDGPATPIIRPKPQYPGCGTGTGQVVLEYSVDADGSVSDVSVVSSSSSCFAQAAQRATRSWRYRPKVEDGQPVRSGRLRVTLVFEPE